MKKVIINADDWGLSPLFNRGTLELIRKKIVTSTTVMINRDFIEPKKLLPLRKISVGLHLELSEKTTLSEIESQIKNFKKIFKKLPSHLDGHAHCHLTKFNLPLVIKNARKYNLPIRSHFPLDRKIIKKVGLKTPDEFFSWHPERISELLKKLKITNKKTIEIVCHPGHFDKNCPYPYNKNRKQELIFLKSLKFKKVLKKFELVNYGVI